MAVCRPDVDCCVSHGPLLSDACTEEGIAACDACFWRERCCCCAPSISPFVTHIRLELPVSLLDRTGSRAEASHHSRNGSTGTLHGPSAAALSDQQCWQLDLQTSTPSSYKRPLGHRKCDEVALLVSRVPLDHAVGPRPCRAAIVVPGEFTVPTASATDPSHPSMS